MLVAAVVLVGTETAILLRGSGRRTLRRAWAAIHAGQLAEGRRLLAPFLDSPFPRRREPARIALLAAARLDGDRAEIRRLLGTIDRGALSAENRRILREEEVRVYVALGEAERAVRAAEALLGEGDAAERRRALELQAYALLSDGRHGAAQRALEGLLALRDGERDAPQRAWALYQLALLRRLERREGEARALLQRAVEEGGDAPAARLAAEALLQGERPERL